MTFCYTCSITLPIGEYGPNARCDSCIEKTPEMICCSCDKPSTQECCTDCKVSWEKEQSKIRAIMCRCDRKQKIFSECCADCQVFIIERDNAYEEFWSSRK